MSKKVREKSFEASLAELEQLVAGMEAGNQPLDAALKHYEQGVQLARECQAALQSARQKVQILQQSAAGAVAVDFAADADAGTDADEASE